MSIPQSNYGQAAIHGVHQIATQLRSSSPHNALTHSMEKHVQNLKSMVASGKSEASIDLYMKGVNKELNAARTAAYNHNSVPEHRFGTAPAGASRLQGHFGTNQTQGQTGYHSFGLNAASGSSYGHTDFGSTHSAPATPAPIDHGLSANQMESLRATLISTDKSMHGGNRKIAF